MQCRSCAGTIPGGSTHCPLCGAATGAPISSRPPAPPAPVPRRPFGLWFMAAARVCVALLALSLGLVPLAALQAFLAATLLGNWRWAWFVNLGVSGLSALTWIAIAFAEPALGLTFLAPEVLWMGYLAFPHVRAYYGVRRLVEFTPV